MSTGLLIWGYDTRSFVIVSNKRWLTFLAEHAGSYLFKFLLLSFALWSFSLVNSLFNSSWLGSRHWNTVRWSLFSRRCDAVRRRDLVSMDLRRFIELEFTSYFRSNSLSTFLFSSNVFDRFTTPLINVAILLFQYVQFYKRNEVGGETGSAADIRHSLRNSDGRWRSVELDRHTSSHYPSLSYRQRL